MININFDLPFLEQLDFFRSKGIEVSPVSWRDVWRDAHARTFTVARVTEMDVLGDIREALDKAKAAEGGMSLKQFKAGLRGTLEKKGWFAPEGEAAKIVMPDGTVRKRLTGWRLDNLFGTNMQAAYSTGRYKQLQEVKELRPYWMYVAVMDSATRPDHAAMNGKIWHADHPVWDQWYPPNGFRCRCYVRSLSERQMKRLNLKEETGGVWEEPDEGFDYNPGKAGLASWKPDFDKYLAQEKALLKKAFQNWVHIPDTQKGSNPGGIFLDPDDKQYYAKFYSSAEQARAEVLANGLLKRLGVGAPRAMLKELEWEGEKRLAVVTEWMEGAEPVKTFLGRRWTAKQKEVLTKHFLAASLNNNWDVVGFDFDNLVRIKNQWYCLDSGGSFGFRAQGGAKAFGASVEAFDSLLEPGRKAARVFKPVVEETLGLHKDDYVKWLRGLTDKKIRNAVSEAGLDAGYANTLIARREDLIGRIGKFNKAAPVKSHIRGHIGQSVGRTASVDLVMQDAQTAGVAITRQKAEAMVRAMRDFSGNDYSRMRHAAMGRISDAEGAQKTFLVEEYLDFAARYPAPESGYLYRGIRGKRNIFNALKVGDVYDPITIASWSTKLSTSASFSGNAESAVVLRVKDPSDYNTTIQHLSKHFLEDEVLMSGRCKWRITGKHVENHRLIVDVELDHASSLDSVRPK